MKTMLRGIGSVMALWVLGTLVACQDDEMDKVPVKSISIVGEYIADGGTSQISALIQPTNASNKEVEWSVSDESVAVISSSGLLTAVSNGNVTVTAKALDGSGVTKDRIFGVSGVEVPIIMVESIVISGNDITDGKLSQMTVEVLPEDADNKVVVWSVSDASIAEISAEGLLVPKNNGSVTVTATATDGSKVKGEKIVSISGVEISSGLVTSITISGSDISNGMSVKFTVEVLPTTALNREVQWSVSDVAIAEIGSDGTLYPKANGQVIITATAVDGSGVIATKTVNISGVPDGTDGTVVSTASELLTALNSAQAGSRIYVRGGNYVFNTRISLSKSGNASAMISLVAYPQDSNRPVFDFSSMSEGSSNRGIQISGNYWHIKGIDIYHAGDNGMYISGSNNTVEFCSFSENADSGLQIGGGGANNTILNCDSYYNADSAVENADGFACKLDAGTGNKFIGCRAWQNLDDGWDGYLRGADNITTTYENCWAVKNGLLKSGAISGGDGNGFKTGGSDDKLLKHNAKYYNCIAAGNIVDGFDHNSNRGSIELYNCGSHSNGHNINFGSSNIALKLVIKNTVSVSGGSDSFNATTTDISSNSWQNGKQASAADYASLDISLLLSPRNADGSLPAINYMKLVDGSDLIDAGEDVGLSFTGSAPDIGPFESGN